MKIAAVVSSLVVAVVLSNHRASLATEIRLVLPNELSDQDGNDLGDGKGLVPYHTQHYWPSSEFDRLPSDHHRITQIALRPDGSVTSPIEFDVEDFEVTLSTTMRTREELSEVFAENHGSDASLVYAGPITLRTESQGPDRGPKDFDYAVVLQTPFHYDPAEGNLLIDIQSTPYGTGAYYDYFLGMTGALVWADSLDAATGMVLDEGLPMQLTFTTEATGLMPGDANQDLAFDQLDLVQVLQAGKYLTGLPAGWGEGDWDAGPGGQPGSPPIGDGVFDSLDVVTALSAGAYLTGPYAGKSAGDARGNIVASVPEPGTVALLAFGLLCLLRGPFPSRSVGDDAEQKQHHT